METNQGDEPGAELVLAIVRASAAIRQLGTGVTVTGDRLATVEEMRGLLRNAVFHAQIALGALQRLEKAQDTAAAAEHSGVDHATHFVQQYAAKLGVQVPPGADVESMLRLCMEQHGGAGEQAATVFMCAECGGDDGTPAEYEGQLYCGPCTRRMEGERPGACEYPGIDPA